jgi:hypothetical protein
MSKGTRLILALSVVIGLGVAVVPPIITYTSCQTGLRDYNEDQQDWAPVLSGSKPIDQVSNRALLRAHGDDDFRAGRWHPPTCHATDNLVLFAAAGFSTFVALFIGAHLAWLATRIFNRLMDKFK